MGVDYKVYVGPYVEVHNPLKDSTEEYYSCDNKKCKNHKQRISAKFCGQCGDPIKLVTFPCKKNISFDIYSEFKGEPFYKVLRQHRPEEYEFYIPNRENSPGISFNPIRCCFFQKEMDGVRIAEDNETFREEYSKFIGNFQDVFGKDNVKIKWGILSWAW